MKSYYTKGVVLGELWQGGEGSYRAERQRGKTRKQVLERAQYNLENNLLTGHGDFQYLIGAYLKIIEVEEIRRNGKPFYAETEEKIYIGKLTKKQQDFLEEMYYTL